ncbi:uncharacterized protein LOC115579945 isoform X2 [Sparus aurata]|uniref:uncharacterized protein LOC115579945 isoform X2 n=1 Tax=Sparus aurata TaxID=8175 RepID=UPI0011C0F737|nr:uncharacterized protein LOC115579945 isoform X2 [Sparus aurata]
MASSLHLKKGAIPTIRDASAVQSASTSHAVPSTSTVVMPQRVHVGCQTESITLASTGTQLSMKTLQPHVKSTGTQTEVKTTDVGVSTIVPDLPWSSMPTKPSLLQPHLSLVEDEDEESSVEASSSFVAPELQDSTYNPEESVTLLTKSTDESEDPSTTHGEPLSTHKIRKLLVFETCLMELFEKRPVCSRVCDIKKNIRGTFFAIVQRCPHCLYQRRWKSQPVIGHSTPAGNLQLSAAIYFCGASFFNVQKVFKAMQLQIHSYKQFRVHCCSFIEPAVLHKWKTDQAAILQRLSQDGSAILGGDMRADSPGHSAKYGSYTLMDLNNNNVIDIQLVQNNEVGGSTNMEKEGLKRSLKVMEDSGIKLDCIVSDRHPQIQKFLTDAKITQYYDVWHFEKASSTSGPERTAKWTSVINHLQDIHTHDDPLYPKCSHAPRVSKDKEKWLKAGTPVLYKLEKLFTGKRVLKDVSKLSPHHQTSSLEAYHSVVIRFVPKSVPFPFLGMLCRLYLSALHYNENSDCPQKQADGKPCFKLYWPRARGGTCTVKPLKEDPTYNYVDELMHLVFDVVFHDPAPFVSQLKQIPVPEPLCSQYDRPVKEDVVARFVSRFNRGAS